MAKKILVVDDEPAMRAMLRSFFELQGCVVSEAGDVEEAVTAAAQERPDAVILDFQMSSYGDGSDAYYELHRSERTASIPIVIYSGAGEASVKAAFPLSARLRFIAKPGNLDALWAAVQELTV